MPRTLLPQRWRVKHRRRRDKPPVQFGFEVKILAVLKNEEPGSWRSCRAAPAFFP